MSSIIQKATIFESITCQIVIQLGSHLNLTTQPGIALTSFYGQGHWGSEGLTESLGFAGNPRSPRRSYFHFPTLSIPSHCLIRSDGLIHQAGWRFVSDINKMTQILVLLTIEHYKQRPKGSFLLHFLFKLHSH